MEYSGQAKLILGTVQLGMPYGINNLAGQPDLSHSFQILDVAYAGGIRILDTAPAYGNSMVVIGQYHSAHSGRQPFHIISKFSLAAHDDVEKELMDQLDKLNVERLYCYHFHRYQDFKSNPELRKRLIVLKERSLIERTGVSVYSNEELEQAAGSAEIDVIQVPFNLLDNDTRRGEILRHAKEKGKEIHSRSVFLQGLFFMADEHLPPKLLPLKKYLRRLHELSHAAGFTMESFALNYVLSMPYIDKVLIGVETPEQLQKNFSAVLNQKMEGALLSEIGRIAVAEEELLLPTNWN